MGPLLAEACRDGHVPGAVLGVLRGGDLPVEHHGAIAHSKVPVP